MFKQLSVSPVVVLAAAVSAANVQALEPATMSIGGFDVLPALTLDQRYDDNIFSQPTDEKESWVTVLTPSVQASADLGATEVLLSYQHSAGLYASSSADNFNDNLASAALGWELNHRNQVDVAVTYNDGHEDRGTGFSQGGGADAIDQPDTFEELTFDGKYTFGSETSKGRLELEGSNYSKEFTNHRDTTRGRDRDDISGGATFFWRIGGKTDLLAEGSYTDIDYVSDPASVVGGFDTLDSELTRYRVGVTWEATGKTQGTIKVGHAKKDFADSDRDDFSGSSWEAEVQWAPKTYSVLSFNTAREPRETNGTGSFIDAETYGVTWRHSWSDVVSTNLYYSFEDETFEDDIAGREDELTTYGVRVDYDMRRWLSLGLSAQYSDKDSSIDEFGYTRNQVTLHLSMSL